MLLLFLGLMGLVLDQAFQKSAEQGVSERLMIHIYGLLAVTEVDEQLSLPEAMQEPSFNVLGSGLFALVFDDEGTELWRSPSALDLRLEERSAGQLFTDLMPGSQRFGRQALLGAGEVFFKSYHVLWQRAEIQVPYTFVVLETTIPFESEIRGFRNNLWGWLLGVVVLLVLVQWRVMSWGLSPLQKLAQDLKAIEDGDKTSLGGTYPAEIQGVTRNLNLLLASEHQQRERYRTTLGDLAHSLKTPLAILHGASSALGHASDRQSIAAMQQTVAEQVARMDEIVGYQLERAVTSSLSPIKAPIDVQPLVSRLISALLKVYVDKNLQINADKVAGSFFGDQRDLMELLGNVLDNACKYGHQYVGLCIENSINTSGLQITVDDDGPGIDESDRTRVLTRGTRLDSTVAGQGIGLAVVGEIVSRYGGTVSIQQSPMGGARLVIELQ
ncbi:MAG: two-component system sensor histidine kinase PhoQ [Candidatus Azotimanducaceae bacterium]